MFATGAVIRPARLKASTFAESAASQFIKYCLASAREISAYVLPAFARRCERFTPVSHSQPSRG
jgi:hypothetical protein